MGIGQVTQTHLQDKGRRSTPCGYVIPPIEAQETHEKKEALLMADEALRFWVKGSPTKYFKSYSQAKKYSRTYDEGPTIIRKGFGGLFSVFRRQK